MMSYLTRPAAPTRQPVVQGGVIGQGGMFQGEDMGYRTGFSDLDPFIHWQTQKPYSKEIIDRIKKYGVKKYKKLEYSQRKAVRDGSFGRIWTREVSGIRKHQEDIAEATEKRIKDFVKNFKKENTRLPKMSEIEAGTGSARGTIGSYLESGVDYLTQGESKKLSPFKPKKNVAEVINYVKSLPDNTVITRKLIQDYIDTNNIKLDLEKFFDKSRRSYLPNHITNETITFDPSYRASVLDTRQMVKAKAILNDSKLKKEFIDFGNKPGVKIKDLMKKFNLSSDEFYRSGLRDLLKRHYAVKYEQDKLFDYLLNSEGPINEKQIAKDLEMKPEMLKKSARNLYQNIYRSFDTDIKKSRFLIDMGYELDQLKNVADKIKILPSDYHDRTLEKLIIDAYGEVPEKLKPLMNKLKKFRELQSKLPEEYQRYFTANMDHVIPFNFLTQIKEGKNPENLIRVKAYPGFLNSTAFKGNIDKALNKAKVVGDKELIKTITELQSFLPEDFGAIDSQGKKVIDYKAEPFNLKTMYSEQQKKFGKAYERAFKFLDNPKVKKLLETAGLSFKAIRDIRRLNAPGFLKSFNQILKKHPELRVEFEDQFGEDDRILLASLDNQMGATMTDVYTGPKIPSKEFEPDKTTGALAAGALFGAKPIAKGAWKYGLKPALKTIGSPAAGLGFAGWTVADNLAEGKNIADAVVDPMVGIDLLLPEVVKQLGSKITSKNVLGKILSLQILDKFPYAAKVGLASKIVRGMTPVGVGLTVAGALKDRAIGMVKEGERISTLEGDEQEQAIENLAAKDYRGYDQGGRVGFAKGPKDPKRRLVLKGLGALTVLPIVGRYFKVGKFLSKAGAYTGPAIEKIKGMPEWLPSLVKRLWNEGEDVTKTASTMERQVVKRGTLESGDDVDLIYQMDTGDVRIDVTPGKGKYETSSGAYNKEYGLELKKGETITEGKHAGSKTADEFDVSEIEGSMDPHAMDVNWEGKITTVDDAMSDLTELEAFAKKQSTKKIHKKKGTTKKDVFPDYDPPEPDYYDID